MRIERTHARGRTGAFAGVLLVGLLASPSVRAQSASPVNDWAGFRTALAACWSVPPGTQGSLIAYRFGLDKTGALRGPPLVTARRLRGDGDAPARYEAAAAAALSRCLPIPVTAAFGAILGESPIHLRFVNTPPSAAYQINSNITLFPPP